MTENKETARSSIWVTIAELVSEDKAEVIITDGKGKKYVLKAEEVIE